MNLFPFKILLLGFICVRHPDLQVKIPISFPTLLRSFTGPRTGAFEARQSSRGSFPKVKKAGYLPPAPDMATYEVDPEIGLDPDVPDYWRMVHFKLHSAVFHNDVAGVKKMLSFGADINLKNQNGWTALDWADSMKRLEVAKILFQTMNIKLHGAEELLKHVHAKHAILVRALLELGLSGMLAKNKRLHKGLLLQACRVSTAAIFKMLINCVPGYMITDYKQIYLQVAASVRNDEVLEALRERARQEEEWRENYFRPSTPVTPVQLPPRDLEYEKVFDEYINPDAYLP